MDNLPHALIINPDGENIISKEVFSDDRHTLKVEVNAGNKYVHLEFSSRQALYDFARSLLHEAVYGQGGQKEFYPLIVEGKMLVVDGARLTEESSRIFINYEESSRILGP